MVIASRNGLSCWSTTRAGAVPTEIANEVHGTMQYESTIASTLVGELPPGVDIASPRSLAAHARGRIVRYCTHALKMHVRIDCTMFVAAHRGHRVRGLAPWRARRARGRGAAGK
jgi:hypothetical protein